jgi:hypothetical protein
MRGNTTTPTISISTIFLRSGSTIFAYSAEGVIGQSENRVVGVRNVLLGLCGRRDSGRLLDRTLVATASNSAPEEVLLMDGSIQIVNRPGNAILTKGAHPHRERVAVQPSSTSGNLVLVLHSSATTTGKSEWTGKAVNQKISRLIITGHLFEHQVRNALSLVDKLVQIQNKVHTRLVPLLRTGSSTAPLRRWHPSTALLSHRH